MPFAFQLDQAMPMLVAYEEVSYLVPDPHSTISAQLIAGWKCPDCDQVLRAITGPWSNPKAQWWEYDHYAASHAHGSDRKQVRPSGPHLMPNYRGEYGLDGGYLYRFDHRRPYGTSDFSYYHNSPSCSLGVSLRVGIEGGVRDMRHATPASTRKLVTGLKTYGPSNLLKLIPDVLGQRDPIVATPTDMEQSLNKAMDGAYSDKARQDAWLEFVDQLIN